MYRCEFNAYVHIRNAILCMCECECGVPLLMYFIPIYTLKERMRHMLFSRLEERNEEDEYCLSHSAVDLIIKKNDGYLAKTGSDMG